MNTNPFQKLDELIGEKYAKPTAEWFTIQAYCIHRQIGRKSASNAVEALVAQKVLESRNFLIQGRYIKHYRFCENQGKGLDRRDRNGRGRRA